LSKQSHASYEYNEKSKQESIWLELFIRYENPRERAEKEPFATKIQAFYRAVMVRRAFLHKKKYVTLFLSFFLSHRLLFLPFFPVLLQKSKVLFALNAFVGNFRNLNKQLGVHRKKRRQR
jgi:hypothetical protein